MEVMLVRHLEGVANLKASWQPLLERSRPNHVFMTWEWLSTWWGHFRAPNRELFVLVVRDKGEFIGVLPLMLETTYHDRGQGIRRLHFLGHRTSDWMDLVAIRKEEVVRFALEYLQKRQDLWDYLDFRSLSNDSSTVEIFGALAPQLGFSFAKETTGICPYMTTTSNWDDFYRMRLPKELRSNLERRLRKLHKEGDVKIEWPDSQGFTENLAALFDMHQRRFFESKFVNEQDRRFYHGLVKTFPAASLYCPVLKLDGKTIAAEFALRHNRKVYGYTFVFDPDYRVFSPGLILLRYIAENCFLDPDVDEFDFLFGDEPYKADWATGQRETCRVLMGNSYMSGWVGKIARQTPLSIRRPITRAFKAAACFSARTRHRTDGLTRKPDLA